MVSTHRPLRRLRPIVAAALAAALGTVLPSATAEAATWSDAARDSFSRSVSSGWGTADSGGSWAARTSGAVALSVTGGAGVVSGLGTGERVTSTLPVSASDVYIASTVTVAGPADADVFHGWRVGQSADGSSYYAVTYRSNPTGSITLGLSKVVRNVSTWIDGVRVSPKVQNGGSMRLELQLLGSELNARVWPASESAPAWQLRATGLGTPATGTVAIDTYVGRTSRDVTMRLDDVAVQTAAVSTPVQPPAPQPPAPQPPAPQPPAPQPPAPQPPATGRGTAIGTQSYPIPSGAVFVDAARGSDAAAGSQSSPVRSVAAALQKAPTGGTIVLRAGNYHESITVGRDVTIQNYPKETVWFDGSRVVSGWTSSGRAWVASGWTASFSSNMGGDSSFYNRFLQASYPMARFPDQVFVDGVALRQVASASAVTTGTFFVDYGADKLYIGTDPSGREVRASDLAQAIKVNASGVTLQGFGVRRYATPYEARGAISQDIRGGVFRHLVVSDNATIGLALSGADKVMDHLLVERNGLLGLGSNVAHRAKLTNSLVRNNNAEHFKFAPVAGGVKITSSDALLISNNEVYGNIDSTGLWLDGYNGNFRIVKNIVHDNAKEQIEVEISGSGIVAGNTATGGETGILVYNSDNVKVFNNEVGGNRLFGIKLAQDARWKTGAKPGFPLLTRNVTIANNVFGCGKTFQFYALDGETNISADRMNITMQGNLFSKRVTTGDPTMVGWGGGDNRTIVRYETPAALSSAKNSGWRNAQAAGCVALSQMGNDIAAARPIGYPLPADVASALGVPSGSIAVGRI